MGIEDIVSGVGAQIGNAANGIGLGFGKGGFSLSANFNQRKQAALSKSRTDAPLRELYEVKYATPDITFPADLDTEHFIRFTVVERVKNKSDGDTKLTPLHSMVLPVPNNLNPQYSARYNDQPMGIAGAFASGQIGSDEAIAAFNSGKAYVQQGVNQFQSFFDGTATDEVKDKIGKVGLAAATVGSVALLGKLGAGNIGAIIGGAIGGAGTAVQGLMSLSNVAVNSHLAVLFDGVGFRNFTFNYRFVPRDPSEANALQDMIEVFKRAMYPALNANNKFLFEYPDEFKIELSPKLQETTFKFKRSVLKDMSVNYNGDGVPRFFDDGNPVVVDVSMTFQEVEILTKDDFPAPASVKPIPFVPDPAGSYDAEMEAYLHDNPDYTP